MPGGPGKYDPICTMAMQQTKAKACAVIIIDGNLGNGFAIQTTAGIAFKLPEILRFMADAIELEDKRTHQGVWRAV